MSNLNASIMLSTFFLENISEEKEKYYKKLLGIQEDKSIKDSIVDVVKETIRCLSKEMVDVRRDITYTQDSLNYVLNKKFQYLEARISKLPTENPVLLIDIIIKGNGRGSGIIYKYPLTPSFN